MSLEILLVNPPYEPGKGYNREGRCTQEAGFWATPWPPFSLAMIAAVLRKDHAVRIMDCPAQNVSEKKLLDAAARNTPDIVIFSVSTETIESDLATLGKLKGLPKRPVVIVFGVHATVFAEDILKNSAVDFVVRGEPEETAKELIAALNNGSDLRGVKGIDGRSESGQIFSTDSRDFIRNLEALPFPAWDLVDLGRYRLPVSQRKFIIINTLRGCPFPCSFCNARAYYGSLARLRSVLNVLDEVKFSIDRYRIRDIFFWSDTFTLVPGHVTSLCAGMISEGLNVRWVANSRADTVDEDMLILMKRAGCWMISFGIESGDDRILESCGKNITVEKIEHAVRMAKAAGIKIAGHFIFGLPGETEETARKTIGLAKKLDLDFAQFYAAVPYPGSPLFEQASSAGWIRGKKWDQFRQSEFVMDLPTLSRESLYRLKRKAYHAFYFRPKTLKTALSLASVRSWISGGLRTVKRPFYKIFKAG